MKKLLLFVLLIWISGFSALQASHNYGMTMRYEHLQGQIYRIFQTYYYDCSGTQCFGYLPISTSNPYPGPGGSFSITTSGCTSYIVTPWTVSVYKDATPVCPTTTTACSNGSSSNIAGVIEVTYYTDIGFYGSTCNYASVKVQGCCMPYNITSGANGQGFYDEMIIPLSGWASENNSPQFISEPILYISSGLPTSISQAAIDIDGDSLVYSFAPLMADSTQFITYNTGYSPTSFLGPSWYISIDSHTGLVNMNANPGVNAVGVLNIKVEEYRNGVLIGSIERQTIVSVVYNSTNTNPASSLNNISGAIYQLNSNEFGLAPNVPFSFDIIANDANTSDLLDYTSNVQTILPNAVLTGSSNTNPMTLHFTWTPSMSEMGKEYYLIFHLKDNHCPLIAYNDFACKLKVDSTYITATTSPSACSFPSGSLNLTVTGNVAPYTFNWNNGATTEDLTNIPSGAYWVNVTDVFGHIWHSDTFYVSTNSITANLSLTPPNCNTNNGIINTNVMGGQAPYTYTWSNGQTNTNINNLGVGGYSLTVTDALGCYFHQSILLDYDPYDSCFTRISGNVYFDANQNCTQDLLEMGLSNILVNISPNGGYMLTDSNGNYSFIVNNVGLYYIQGFFTNSFPNSSNCTSLPFTQSIYVGSLGIDSTHNDFAVHFSPDISITHYEQGYVPGLAHNTYIHCKNTSYYNLDTAIVTYQHDSLLINPTFTPLANNYDPITRIATWIIPNFNVGTIQNLTVHGTTMTSAVLGDTVRSYTNILPLTGDFIQYNNHYTFTRLVSTSYDPNNKEVFPQGETQFGLIPPTQLRHQLPKYGKLSRSICHFARYNRH